MKFITIIIGIVAAIGFFYLVGLASSRKERQTQGLKKVPARLRGIEDSASKLEAASSLLDMKDYRAHIYAIEHRLPNLHEFSVHNTPAAILWEVGNTEVGVVANKNIVKGVPQSLNFDRFSFDIEHDTWSGPAPRGSAALCKAEIKSLLHLIQPN